MAGTTPPIVFAGIAQQIANAVNTATEEETIFKEALEIVKANPPPGNMSPDFFVLLNNAKTVEDVSKALERAQAQHSFWNNDKARSFIRTSAKWADGLLAYKSFVDYVVPRSANLAAPIWGSVVFVFTILKTYDQTRYDLFDKFEGALSAAIQRFTELFTSPSNSPLPTSLRNSLLKFYQKIIEVSIGIWRELNRNKFVTVGAIVQNSLKKKIEDFLPDLARLTSDVDHSASHFGQRTLLQQNENLSVRLDQIESNQRMPLVTLPAPATSQNVTTATRSAMSQIGPYATTSFSYGVPSMMLSRYFHGRGQSLRNLWNVLNSRGFGQPIQMAIHGLRGVGKTQMLLKFAQDNGPRSNRAPECRYDHVFWINGSERANTDRSFFRLALRLCAVGRSSEDKKNEVAANLSNWFQEHSRWLLIIDDVKDFDVIRAYLPTDSQGQIVISTSDKALAGTLTPDSTLQPLEILPMDHSTTASLAKALAQDSLCAEDKTQNVADKVADFANGLPIAVEQIVHSAIFFKRSIISTLGLVSNRLELLRQSNHSTYHEHNMSMGALVSQAMEDIGANPQAQALFNIILFFSPSSIPLSLLQRGGKHMQSYATRSDSFVRGQRRTATQAEAIRKQRNAPKAKFSLWDYEPFSATTYKELAQMALQKARPSEINALPLDEVSVEAQIRLALTTDTPIARLFSNPNQLSDAISYLKNAWLVKQIDSDTLWMHDLYHDIGKEFVCSKNSSDTAQLIQMSATLVYLAFPIPTTYDVAGKWTLCQTFLPHAISCHKHMKSCGMLNNTCLGPELSHVIGSTLLTTQAIDNQITSREAAIPYFRDAFAGYAAGWKRLSAMPNVTIELIVSAAKEDMLFESSYEYEPWKASTSHERFGKSSPWRMAQTARRLMFLFHQGGVESELTVAMSLGKLALATTTLLFGRMSLDSQLLSSALFEVYTTAQRWQAAYEIAVETMSRYIELDLTTGEYNRNITLETWIEEATTYKSLSDPYFMYGRSLGGLSWINAISRACMQLPDKQEEAIFWLKYEVRLTTYHDGEHHFRVAEPMSRLAMTYEKIGNLKACVRWWAEAVISRLDGLDVEGLEWDRLPNIGRSLPNQEQEAEIVDGYEDARRRLGAMEDIRLAYWTDWADARCKHWRRVRKEFGVFRLEADMKAVLAKAREQLEFDRANPDVDM